MNEIFNIIIGFIDWPYILMCNAITMLVINWIINITLKIKKLNKNIKRAVSAGVAVLVGILFVTGFQHDFESVFNGFFIQFLTYDYIFKSLIKGIQNKVKGIGDKDTQDKAE